MTAPHYIPQPPPHQLDVDIAESEDDVIIDNLYNSLIALGLTTQQAEGLIVQAIRMVESD